MNTYLRFYSIRLYDPRGLGVQRNHDCNTTTKAAKFEGLELFLSTIRTANHKHL